MPLLFSKPSPALHATSQVLLGNHHALYLRSNYKFASMKAVGEMLMDRVDTITDWTSSSPTLNLIFSRNVALPGRFSDAGIKGRQEGDTLILEGGGKLASLGLDEGEKASEATFGKVEV